ncbi:hypothetical protein STEG23_031219 [Scotinomys teguina]
MPAGFTTISRKLQWYQDFIDLTLLKTQSKTLTVTHKHYQIHRIRHFYMRKVKFTQQNCHDRLSQILTDSPKLDDFHPFYADLMNSLYDKDHYKLALGQINIAKNLVGNIAKDYVQLMKYARRRSCSQTPRDVSGLQDVKVVKKAKTMMKKAQKKMDRLGKKGGADKHFLPGKRKADKNDRRERVLFSLECFGWTPAVDFWGGMV